MTMSKSTQPTARKRIVIKLGGSMLERLNETHIANFKSLQEQGIDLLIVHGGGPAINKQLEKNGVTSTTVGGIRVTSEEAVSIVQSTLIGQVNPPLVHQLNKGGITAIGLSGYDNLLTCTFLDKDNIWLCRRNKRSKQPTTRYTCSQTASCQSFPASAAQMTARRST